MGRKTRRITVRLGADTQTQLGALAADLGFQGAKDQVLALARHLARQILRGEVVPKAILGWSAVTKDAGMIRLCINGELVQMIKTIEEDFGVSAACLFRAALGWSSMYAERAELERYYLTTGGTAPPGDLSTAFLNAWKSCHQERDTVDLELLLGEVQGLASRVSQLEKRPGPMARPSKREIQKAKTGTLISYVRSFNILVPTTSTITEVRRLVLQHFGYPEE